MTLKQPYLGSLGELGIYEDIEGIFGMEYSQGVPLSYIVILKR